MNKKGFTLVELLVVIAIIGLLATLAFVSLNSARAKARDAKRVSDVRQVQSALELYYNNQVEPGYPPQGAADTPCNSGDACWAGLAGVNTTLPSPPVNDDCTTAPLIPDDADIPGASYDGALYYYEGYDAVTHLETGECITGDTGCAGYEITYCLGGATGGISAGVNTASETGIN